MQIYSGFASERKLCLNNMLFWVIFFFAINFCSVLISSRAPICHLNIISMDIVLILLEEKFLWTVRFYLQLTSTSSLVQLHTGNSTYKIIRFTHTNLPDSAEIFCLGLYTQYYVIFIVYWSNNSFRSLSTCCTFFFLVTIWFFLSKNHLEEEEH